jgi:hypothetical protein
MIDTKNTLVSLHLAKTGGMTLTNVLQQVYADQIQYSYGDERDAKVENPLCYHGHFILNNFADELLAKPKIKLMTFLRDPLKTAISTYYFGVKYKSIKAMGLDKWLTRTEEFCWPNPPSYSHNCFSNFINHTEEWFNPIDIIGITEYFDESIKHAANILGWPDVEYESQNVGSYKAPDLSEATIHTFYQLNAEDYKLYDSVVKRLLNQ